MNASLEQPFVRAASAVRASRANMADAARWMHPSWSMALLDIDAAQFSRWASAVWQSSRGALERASLALCETAGVAPPALEQLSLPLLMARPEGAMPNPALFDACPAALGLQILRMRALSFRRVEVRRLIDGLLVDFPSQPRFERDGELGGLGFEPVGNDAASLIGASAALGLAFFIAEHGTSRLGICRASDCDDAYIDESKNCTKICCSPRCTRLENVRAFRARQRGATS